MSRERPVLSSRNETMAGGGTLHHTPCAFSPTLIVRPTKGFRPVFLIHHAAPSRLYFVKVSLSLARVLQAGEHGQTYRKCSPKESCPTMSPSPGQIFIGPAPSCRFVISSSVSPRKTCHFLPYTFPFIPLLRIKTTFNVNLPSSRLW